MREIEIDIFFGGKPAHIELPAPIGVGNVCLIAQRSCDGTPWK